GRFCNGIDVCQNGVCESGAPPDCNDGVFCTTDSCDDSLNRCVHVSQQGCCQSDADCVDADACTTDERCLSGTCASYTVSCPSTPCAAAFCDPQTGCGVMPLPNGVNCSIACDVLTPRHFVMRPDPGGVSFSLKATFETASSLDPTLTGFAFEIADP